MFTYLNKLITKPNKNYARSAPHHDDEHHL